MYVCSSDNIGCSTRVCVCVCYVNKLIDSFVSFIINIELNRCIPQVTQLCAGVRERVCLCNTNDKHTIL